MDGIDVRDDIERRVRVYAVTHAMFDGASRVLVGFSGGADSTALLMLMWRTSGAPVVAVHLNHGLRGAAAACDAAWCAAFCRARGIPFESHDLVVRAARRPGENLEAAARRCRLEFWERHAGAATVVALGHHADDCLEDTLLRLARGANASGATGLRPRRTVCGVRMVRPMLELRRSEIEAYLRACGIDDWRVDATNRDTNLRRNAVRHRLLPLWREIFGGDAGLRRALEAFRQDAECLEAAARAALPGLRDRNALRQMPPAVLQRAVRLLIQDALGRDLVPCRRFMARLSRELERQAPQAVIVPVAAGVALVLDRSGLRIAPAGAPLPAQVWRWRTSPTLELPQAGCTLAAAPGAATTWRRGASDHETFRLADLPEELTVRAWRPGDRMVPFGHRSEKKLKDIFNARGIPPEGRRQVPLVLAGERIIWAAGVHRAEFGRIADAAAEEGVRLSLLRGER